MFDNIAEDWKRKRQNPWKSFIDELLPYLNAWILEYTGDQSKNLIFLDLGAGSGRHSQFFTQYCHTLVELDSSRQMLVQNQFPTEKIQADLKNLPFRSNIFDGVFSIASFHHIRHSAARRKSIYQIHTITRLKGLITITVWRFKQKKFMRKFKEQITKQSQQAFFEQKVSDVEIGDVEVPWTISQKGDNLTVYRFYHLFRAVEFRDLMKIFQKIHLSSFGSKKRSDNFLFIGIKCSEKKELPFN